MTENLKQTHMALEIQAIPDFAENLLSAGADQTRMAGDMLRELDPAVVTTIARGSSDHAASYLKYAIEILTGVPVSSTGPSIASIYNAQMKLPNAVTFAVSQSGKSPDILSMAEGAKKGGSKVISLTNTNGSPLAESGDISIDIGAGPELSVAATKTFVLSIMSGLMIVADWTGDKKLKQALQKLPGEFANALQCDWSPLADRICSGAVHQSLYVLGRGPAYSIAKECALKFKETCLLHAEAYSGAEVMHGPVSIAQGGFPVLALVTRDASEAGMLSVINQISGQGADVYRTSDEAKGGAALPFATGSHSLTDPLVQAVSFYVFIEKLARRLGHNPDTPPYLNKETSTV